MAVIVTVSDLTTALVATPVWLVKLKGSGVISGSVESVIPERSPDLFWRKV